jgi:apolipoprotein N-acyltransferase
LTLAAGALAALALAPVFALPLLFLTLPLLVWSIDGIAERPLAARMGAAFGIGWWFGFGYFLVGLHWIGAALLVEPERFAWALPLAIAGLPAGLALFPAAGVAIAAGLWAPGYARICALALGWTALEWLRGTVLTGFPWNLLGQAAAGWDGLMQTASVTGDLGLTLILVLVAAAPATLAGVGPATSVWRRAAPTLAGLAVLAGLWAGGEARLANAGNNEVSGIALRIVQPNIAQDLKWDSGFRDETVRRYLAMTAGGASGAAAPPPTHVVWPETALPMLMLRDATLMSQIAAALPAGGYLIAGALRAAPVGADWDYYNSVVVVAADGTVLGAYDKRHLVPFGEFLPFQSWLEGLGLTQLTGLVGGFSVGRRAPWLAAGAAPPFAPLVCYEVIFSGALHPGAPRPGWLVNVTNDAWYGNGFGPRQHLAQARLRAVEEGLALVRAANTGISAVIDPYGRLVEALPYGTRGVIDAALPAPLPATVFATWRHAPLAVAMAALLVVLVWRFSRNRAV